MPNVLSGPELLGAKTRVQAFEFRAGGTLETFDIVRLSSFAGEHPVGLKANAASAANCAGVLGIVTEKYTSGEYGILRRQHVVQMNTLGGNAGDPVYLSDTGALALVPGTQSLQVGQVLTVGSSGWVLVMPNAYGSVSGGGGSGGGNVLVFRPGGVAVENVYTSWASLYAAYLTLNGPVTVQVDDTIAPAAMSGANLDLNRMTLVGGVWQPTLEVPAGVTWATAPVFLNAALTLEITSGGVVYNVTNAGTVTILSNGCKITNTTPNPAITIGANAFSFMDLQGDSELGDGVNPVVQITDSTAEANFSASTGGSYNDNSITNVALTTPFVRFQYSDSAAEFGNMPGLSSTNFERSYNARFANIVHSFEGATGAYVASPTSDVILCNPAGAPMTIALASSALWVGREITIKNDTNDVSGITINAFAGDLIDGAAFQTIVTARGILKLIAVGPGVIILV